MNYTLTNKQQNVWDFIHSYKQINGEHTSPSFEEIKDGLGYASKGCVHRMVNCMVERGRVIKLPYRARTLMLVNLEEAKNAISSETNQA